MGKKNLLILTIALILPLAGAVPGLVAEGTTHPCVVLVGVGKYADPQILSRPFAEDDVKALYDVITSKEYLGIDPQHVRLLLSEVDPKRPSQVATHQNIVDAFKWAASNAGRDDLVLVALVMQGAPLGERSLSGRRLNLGRSRQERRVGFRDRNRPQQAAKSPFLRPS
jgi:hypothetical protein